MAITRDSENLYSSMRFVGDGVTKRVPLTFDLREGDGLAVDFGEGLVTEGYLIDYETTPVVVVFSEPLPLDKTVTIRRLTKIDKVKHIFQWTGNAQGGADFSAKNVDENFEQITRASQDAMDAQVLASQTLEEMAGIRDDAIDARDKAKVSETNAKQSEVNSKDSELKAKVSETNAKSSETKAKTSELNAKDSENEAKLSETNAKASEVNSKGSETNSKQSELNAKASEVSASVDASQVAQDKVYVTSLKEDVVRLHAEADVSADKAKSSELASKGSEELARKWATNPVDVPVEGSEYSAYHWAKQAESSVGGITPEVQEALDLKLDKTQVKSTFGYSTTDGASQKLVTDVNVDLSKKANKVDVDNALALKVDKTELDSSLALKGDITYIDAELAKKRDLEDTHFNSNVTVKGGAILRLHSAPDGLGYIQNMNADGSFNSNLTVPKINGTIALTSDIPAIDYGRTCALGAVQTLNATIDDLSTLLRKLPDNSVVGRYYTSSDYPSYSKWRLNYYPILRRGW